MAEILIKNEAEFTKSECNYISSMLTLPKKAVEFITKGKCTIIIEKECCIRTGTDEDIEMLRVFTKENQEDVPKALKHFGWDVLKTKGRTWTGEGILAYTLFQWLMSEGNNDEEINKVVVEDILKRLTLSLKEENNGKNK